MTRAWRQSRRRLLQGTVTGVGLLLAGETLAGETPTPAAEQIPATEDLMREHGVLNRILLIYEEGLRRLASQQEMSPEVFSKSATLIRKFVEDYHEKLEEDFIFPEFEKRNQLVELVQVLRQQHQAGRRVTDVILRVAGGEEFRTPAGREALSDACRGFIRMYRPHEAREDSVVFPAVRTIVSPKRVEELGEQFEQREDQLFGAEGFQKTVEQVAELEKSLGIYELAQFTPSL